MGHIRKCIVWDLDNTLWDGVSLEGNVTPRSEVVDAIRELDRRGILHSIASRGEMEVSMEILRRHGLDSYFLVPKIDWLPKTQNIVRIAEELGLGLDGIAFVDDDPFELEQVAFMLPEVLAIEADAGRELPRWAEFSPSRVTEESRNRRQFYRSDLVRKGAEKQFATREEFLVSCGMRLRIRKLEQKDIPRAVELMTRTHQLNTTGIALDEGELSALLSGSEDNQRVFVAELTDKFGGYGIVGIAITANIPFGVRISHLAVSCRVMGRGIERAILATICRQARERGFVVCEGLFRDTGRNRMMRALYQMMGFEELASLEYGPMRVLALNLATIPPIPRWLEVG
jgi:FkbH-like protein